MEKRPLNALRSRATAPTDPELPKRSGLGLGLALGLGLGLALGLGLRLGLGLALGLGLGLGMGSGWVWEDGQDRKHPQMGILHEFCCRMVLQLGLPTENACSHLNHSLSARYKAGNKSRLDVG